MNEEDVKLHPFLSTVVSLLHETFPRESFHPSFFSSGVKLSSVSLSTKMPGASQGRDRKWQPFSKSSNQAIIDKERSFFYGLLVEMFW